MMLLEEEITEMKKDGEVSLAMAAKAKIGILGEDISRNGGALIRTLDDTDLQIVSKSEKCNGKIQKKVVKSLPLIM